MKNSAWLFILVASFFLASCNSQPQTPRITFSHILSDRSEWHVGAVEWKKRVESQLGDAIQIRLITNASLSNNNQRNELEMVQAGTLGGSWESSILLTNSDPRWTVWSMPWLFDSYDEAERVCQSDLGQEMLASLEDIGIVGLAYGFNGFRHITNAKRPVNSMDDLSNLKIRVPSLQMYISLFRLWGADPSQMNFGDLFIALREGTMDGQENPLHVIRLSGIYELQPYLTQWHYSFDPLIFCISKTVWDHLTPEVQAVLRTSAQEAAAVQRETVVKNEEEHLAYLQEQGVQISKPDQQAINELHQASQPIYQEYESIIGAELMLRFIEATSP